MAMTRQENCNSVFDFVLVLLNLQMTVFQHLFSSKCVCKLDNSTLSINLYHTLQMHSPPCKFLFHLSNLLLSLYYTAAILQALLRHIHLLGIVATSLYIFLLTVLQRKALKI